MRSSTLALSTAAAVLLALSPSACSTQEPEETSYFERTIAPILTTTCVRTNTGAACHVADERGNALGNLDLSTYEGVEKRRDLLENYGPYGQPAFLVKNIPPVTTEVVTFEGTRANIVTDIKHTGGPLLDPSASAYRILRRWIDNGATENNTGRPAAVVESRECSTVVPARAGFDPNVDPPRADFGAFRDRVSPMFRGACAQVNCHGNEANDLYLTCGDSPEQVRWNYHAAVEYLAQTAEQSELLRRPLDAAQGGSFHEGGVIFQSSNDDGYQALSQWANEHGPPDFGDLDPNFRFFANRVQPVLVRKGCMMLQCHSAAQFHDYRLRGGSGGSFSLSASRRNYELSLEQLALETDDIVVSRLVRKNLYRPETAPGARGIAHRGGPLLEDFGRDNADGSLCDAVAHDYDAGDLNTIPALCVIREWQKRERASRQLAPLSSIVYVKRPPRGGSDRAQDFDVYSAGSDLRLATIAISATREISVSNDVSLTAGCGLDPSTADIRRPAASWDAKRIAFAARASAAEPLQIYVANADGSGCAKHAEINAGQPSANGLLVHNFDPQFAPIEFPGGPEAIVFASTRGNLDGGNFDYSGPQRTPANPEKPNANLYVFDPGQPIRQLTYLLNMERHPSFMVDGRLIMTTEKRQPEFYQLALRRQNLDGGDYHPLFAQRSSIGYHEAQQVVELADKNFAAVFSEPGVSHGGGAIGIFNRSIGIDFKSQNPADFPVDPSVLDPASLSSPDPRYFLHSLGFVAGVSGRPGEPTTGLFTSPAPLPDGRILVSYGAASDAGAFGGDYDLYVIDPDAGSLVKILGDAGTAEVEAVPLVQRAFRPIFRSTADEPNGHTRVEGGKSDTEIYFLDTPLLASLLFQNTPTGRLIENVSSVDFLESLPPPPDVTSFAQAGDKAISDAFGQVYVRRRVIGTLPLAQDGSARVRIPGGVPFLLRLPESDASRERGLPRVQRETMNFVPGERASQSFKRGMFNGLCGTCHGALSGRAIDAAVNPDILTQASTTEARGSTPVDLNLPPNQRGPEIGP